MPRDPMYTLMPQPPPETDTLIRALRAIDSNTRYEPLGLAEITGTLALCGVPDPYKVACEIRDARTNAQLVEANAEIERKRRSLNEAVAAMTDAHNFLRSYGDANAVAAVLASAISGLKPEQREARLASMLSIVRATANQHREHLTETAARFESENPTPQTK